MTDEAFRKLVGSVLMIGFRGLNSEPDTLIRHHILESSLGGVILFDVDFSTGESGRNITSSSQLRELTSQLQAASGQPLLIAVDQEGGRVARLNPRNGYQYYPCHADLGKKAKVDETRSAASQIAGALAEGGVNVNFAPVVDLNLNPHNPVIGALGRSFSSNSQRVIKHARAFIISHRRRSIACAIKHFPGHGSSQADTHEGPADVTDTFRVVELEPYRALISEDIVDLVMVGHLMHRRFDSERPASLSPKIINGLLRREVGFDGVVVTDDLDMAACTNEYSLEERVALALNAGADLLLFGNNVTYDPQLPTKVIKAIRSAVNTGVVTLDCLREHAEHVNRLRMNLTGKTSLPR